MKKLVTVMAVMMAMASMQAFAGEGGGEAAGEGEKTLRNGEAANAEGTKGKRAHKFRNRLKHKKGAAALRKSGKH